MYGSERYGWAVMNRLWIVWLFMLACCLKFILQTLYTKQIQIFSTKVKKPLITPSLSCYHKKEQSAKEKSCLALSSWLY